MSREISVKVEPAARQSGEELIRTKTQLEKTTERFETQTEEDLRVSAERLQLAAAMTGFGIHDFNVLENLDYWSPELKIMNGYAAAEEITFAKTLATLHPDDREFIESAMAAALDPAGDGEYEREFRIVRADNGETRWFYKKSRTIFIGDGAERRHRREHHRPQKRRSAIAEERATTAAFNRKCHRFRYFHNQQGRFD